jgi:hypothetical protein
LKRPGRITARFSGCCASWARRGGGREAEYQAGGGDPNEVEVRMNSRIG